ncbi:hypothetical protein NDU88_005319 [Pleurodeles waltl]|uniref:DDE Tnp4 domain-containing protein n=1 Tax=Pleurodeles waltl TaxID=8319 RepID=A0AAV7WAP7_PLEWA|nr:hypothetical protein NDU88_005319 [Pleurodeles waltl]
MLHGREVEPENDAQSDLHQKLTPGSGQALKWGKHTCIKSEHTEATAEQQKGDMEVLLIQSAHRRRAQQQQQQLPQHQQGPQRQRRRQERIFRTRIILQGLREHVIIQRYRLNWQAIQQLLRNIEPQLGPTLLTPRTIPTETKLLAVLHMLASGSFQSTGALVAGISQSSFSAFLPKVLDAIIGLTPCHICFPNTLQKQQEARQGFYLISGFPHVLGAIDRTHVRLEPPAATEHLYRNRKQTHSINVQAIVDHQGVFTNIVAKYPGSVHDSFIFRHSTINQHFQDGRYGNGLLVECFILLVKDSVASVPLALMGQRCLEPQCPVQRCLERRCPVQRCLEQRFPVQRCLERQCPVQRCLEQRCPVQWCLRRGCPVQRCLRRWAPLQ